MKTSAMKLLIDCDSGSQKALRKAKTTESVSLAMALSLKNGLNSGKSRKTTTKNFRKRRRRRRINICEANTNMSETMNFKLNDFVH